MKRQDMQDNWEDFSLEKEEGPKKLPVIIILTAVVLILCGVIGAKLVAKYSYSKQVMDLSAYYHIEDQTKAAIELGDEIREEQAIVSEGEYYIPYSFVREQIQPRFYFDESLGMILYATPTQLYQIPKDSMEYMVDGNNESFTCKIWMSAGNEMYVSLSFLHNFADFSSQTFDNPSRVLLYVKQQSNQTATVLKDSHIRYQGGVKSDILKAVSKGEELVVLEKMENWSKVKSCDGIMGYIENKQLKAGEDKQINMPGDYVAPEYTSLTRDHIINMAWHQVTNETANAGVTDLLSQTKGVNVISPTWYFLSDNNGNFTNISSKAYVDEMHAKGIEVWALIDNFTNDVDTMAILKNYAARQNMIAQLVTATQANGADGINVDFENVKNEAGEAYVEFLRELSIACRKNGIVLSVDNYVPTGYTAHYDRAEQGRVVDYVVIMGYDEHYAGSPQAGSVASIEYVKQGIEKTVSVVPANKVINGVPFFTRLWKLSDKVTSEALSMSGAQNVLAQNGISAAWDEQTCQNYAQYESEGATYQIWLEDAKSLSAKLSVMSTFPIGGVAEWKLGLETPDVWEVIQNYVQNAPVPENVILNNAGQASETGDEQTAQQTSSMDGQPQDAGQSEDAVNAEDVPQATDETQTDVQPTTETTQTEVQPGEVQEIVTD